MKKLYFNQEDFEQIAKQMDTRIAIQILEDEVKSHFPYHKPDWGFLCNETDLKNYTIWLAITHAIACCSTMLGDVPNLDINSGDKY